MQIWYPSCTIVPAAQHNLTTQAILHALYAQEWQWAADLIERKSIPLMSQVWGPSYHTLVLLQQWVSQLPAEVMHARPLLCYASSVLLFQVAPVSMAYGWLDAAEAILTTALDTQTHADAFPTMLPSQRQPEQQDLFGAMMGLRAMLCILEGDGWAALAICERALTLTDNVIPRSQILTTQALALYISAANDAMAAVQSAFQAVSLVQDSGIAALTLNTIGYTITYTIGTGQLHKVQRLIHQAMLLGKQPGGPILPEMGYPFSFQAEILREWNELDRARSVAEEAVSLCKQSESVISLVFLLSSHAILLRVYLSRGELDAARSALQECERIGKNMNQSLYHLTYSHFTIIDQVKLWLAYGELDHCMRWAENLDLREQHNNSYIYEREEVAYVRVLLAKHQPAQALERLEPVLQRATTGQRWGHVIEIRLLQALAYQMHQQETQALETLLEAMRLAEPENYIRSFVDEGAQMAVLLSRLRQEQHKQGLTPYLNRVLAAFPQESKGQERQPKQLGERTKAQELLDPLSERELEVLALLAKGASNQEIAQELVIVVDTVKRHVSHIFSKLGVRNRVQAVREAQAHGLLDWEYNTSVNRQEYRPMT